MSAEQSSPPADAADTPQADEEVASPVAVPKLGAAIRRLRAERRLSLHELSALSGVSSGMISQIERDIANPSLRLLTKLRLALGAPVGSLFEDALPAPADPAFVRRQGRRPTLELGYVTKELLSSTPSQGLQFMILHIPPQGSSGDRLISYPADKGGLVLEGRVLLRVRDEEAELRQGDSFMFDSREPHGFRNTSGRDCRVLWIIGAVPIERHL